MRKTTSFENRVRVRAYFIALKRDFKCNPVNAWLAAEHEERALAKKRSAAVAKGNHTRSLRKAAATAQMTARLRNEMRAH